MIECDAFKLIEELIKNTTDTNNRLLMQTKLHNSNNQSTLDDNAFKQTSDTTQPLDQLYLNLNFSTKTDDLYLTPPISINDMKTEILSNKPNRPYSYYIATNYHPLDLSLINEDINETETEPVSKKVTKRIRKKTSNNKSKRLSTSLGDLTNNCIDFTMTTNNTTHNTPVIKKKVRSLSKDKDFEIVDEFTDDTNNFFNRRRGGLSSEKNIKLTNQYSSTRRLNKFLRSIFRLDSEPIEPIEEPANESRFKSKINRFFSSFRTTSNVAKKKKTEQPNQQDLLIIETTIHTELLVMDESNQIMLPEIKLEISLPELNFKKELCYSEIEDRLKQLTNVSDLSSKSSDTTGYESACSSSFSKKNDNSPLSSPLSIMSSSVGSFQMKSLDFDIPFIDEDSESVYDFKEQDEDLNIKSTLTSASASSSSTETSSNDNNLNYVTDSIIRDYLKHLNYDMLHSIVNSCLSKSEWSNIVLVFDLTNRAIQMLDQYSDNIEIVKLKEICAKYINNKYYDFINQNGGLVS